MTDIMNFTPIGVLHSPFSKIENMPIQPLNGENIKGYVEIFPEYTVGLQDLDGFSHITLIYYFHKISDVRLMVKPFMDNEFHGVFATRSPARPNKIGISTVRLLGIENNTLQIENVDFLNGTPLLDIKPFYPAFDNRIAERVGW